MKWFSSIYDRVITWSRHRYAPRYLAALSFSESSFFPIPPDVMLAPMVLANPHKAWNLALITTVTSVLGGVLGYLIGMFSFELVEPLLQDAGYYPKYLQAKQWFDEWGFWAVFLAGFSPIPYKVFTITAGVISMAFLPFVVASAIGRGARFYLVAGLLYWGGDSMEKTLRKYIDIIGWATVALVIVLLIIIKW
jgi:membrane protein YqaA with SNARE-associated domain